MVTVKDVNSPELVRAVQIWTGWRLTASPARDDNRLRAQLGSAAAHRLLPVIKSLERDFYLSEARLTADDLREMEKLASSDFREKYPDVADDIVKAFAWCYTYDFK